MRTRRCWSTAVVQRVRDLYVTGMPLKKVASTVSEEQGRALSLHTVHHWIYDERRRDAVMLSRVPVPNVGRVVWPPEVVQRARVLRERARLGEKVIARVLATEMDPSPSANTVREWIREGVRLAA